MKTDILNQINHSSKDEYNKLTLDKLTSYMLDLSTSYKKEKQFILKEYDIWMGGYAATGEHSTAQYLGKHKGRNFQDACMRYFMKSHLEQIEKNDINDTYYDTKRFDYDPYKNTFWACILTESEEEARKQFG
jgi:hypothetical protein